MTLRKKLPMNLAALFILALSLAAVGCGEKKGPAEKAGESIDETIDDAQEKAEDIIDNDGPAENAGEAVDDAAEDAKESVD